ncbi:Trx-2 [Drosophila busckii]|uniref:Trx-2 n=1 Tax=Drosophila busckii TaxID=30019 RepID=A0A0M4F8K3_DROBS|nr:thioredoxin-2 [Drosophila busckii]XP_017850962.1 thioredoxin-2 [Drosophila busckii]ALC48357.1 Trx-2 [Drosophila busckii]
MVHMVQSKEDFEEQLTNAGDKLIVIDFCANWCGPCKIIAPKLEELAIQYADRAVVLKVNVDENEEITNEYNITSMPTFVFIKSGEVLEVFVGGNSDKLVKSMEKYVGDVEASTDQPATEINAASEGADTEQATGPATSSQDMPATLNKGVLDN